MTDSTLLNDRYQLLNKLGSGGMADVFRARDLMLDRYVAIKVLRKDHSANEDFQNSFRMEARAAANLSHPSIVTVHDFGFADNLLFIVMEFIHGKDLKQLIRERGRFSVEAGIPLIIQACAGLGYAHRAGLVHCDVKPHNMLQHIDDDVILCVFKVLDDRAGCKDHIAVVAHHAFWIAGGTRGVNQAGKIEIELSRRGHVPA